MNIFIIGNRDLAFDSLPLRILPKLKKRFPKISFKIKDPNEEWDASKELTIIDTVKGIKEVQVFSNLDSFIPSPTVTLHNFDAFTQLKLLEKLGKLSKIKIIGIPPIISEKKAFQQVSVILTANLL